MSSYLKKQVSLILGITIGSLLYVVLNVIPIIGPFIVGLTSGKIAAKGNIKKGFFVGCASGIIGYFLLLNIFSGWISSWNVIGKLFVGSLLFLWNFFAIIISGLGGIVGSISTYGIRKEIFSNRDFFNKNQSIKEKDNKIKTFIVCKNCKTANDEENVYCSECREKLR